MNTLIFAIGAIGYALIVTAIAITVIAMFNAGSSADARDERSRPV